ncbi:MAG TPA: hypothetical protein PKL09_01580 [bacterium]|nr:hypothetical protein [bacterium]HNS33636.1 hypothetical protein [bacterium]HNZ73220.1 hypothetical protein [bacterium]HOH67090.1 hypothetical protein [bacterium]
MNKKKLATKTKTGLNLQGVSQATSLLLGVSILVGTIMWLIFVLGKN